MRLKVRFDSDKNLSLPLSYSYPLQSAVYETLSSIIHNSHEHGLDANGRVLKVFVFSRLSGQSKLIRDGSIYFTPPISLRFSSPLEDYTQAFANGLLKEGGIKLTETRLELKSIEVEPKMPRKDSISARTISPVTVYSTLKTFDGKKRTYFYNPAEKDFVLQLKENLNRKAIALGISVGATDFLSFELKSKPIQRIVKYKNFVQIAWDFSFKLNTDPELIAIAFDWGLGSKNAQGFGMIEIVERR
ncbi:MAG TPA: CRISPR-associated endoribonuclease Cas6 [Mesotoga infera]|nr:CRISPR-associated endoribonuclease Cas6 [Mesotoga infera]